ncbi:uncharacterized protein METZ01_LOCUS217256 [marine metagenome]|uniref:DUF4159 domain-containing protein n=1 Tax=marine metagenome TaxID=408172 RepID=A0A382FP54_9ZZZZ
MRKLTVLVAALLLLGATEAAPDFQFALLRYEGGNWSPRSNGLSRLSWEIRKRTSIHTSLNVAHVSAESDELFNYPIVFWQGDTGFPKLSSIAVTQLRQFLKRGGTLVVDLSDGQPQGPFDLSVRRELRRIFPAQKLERIESDHVLYKSFYLLDRHGGRVPARAHLEGIMLEERLAVIQVANDMAGAMARDEFGAWKYDVQAGGDTAREITFRLGINLVMYALCLDYKEDQVHIPFILQRRQ